MVSESPCGSEGEQKHKPFSAEWCELPKLLSLLPVCVIADCPKFWSSLAGHLILQGLQSWWSVEKGKKSRSWLWSWLPIALEGERCLRVLGLGPGALGVGSSLAQGEWKSSDFAGIGTAPPRGNLESSPGSKATGGRPGIRASAPGGSPSFLPLLSGLTYLPPHSLPAPLALLLLKIPPGLSCEHSVMTGSFSPLRSLGTSTFLAFIAHSSSILFKPKPPIYRPRRNYLVSFWLWVSCYDGSTSAFQMIGGPQILGLLEN